MKTGYILLLASTMAIGAAGLADASETTEPEAAGPRFTLNGFGTLGLARSDDDDIQFVRDLSQPYGLTREWSAKIDSMLGLQGSYQFSDRLEGVLQVISRYRYDGSYRPEVSWGFLRYDPSPTLSLRAGRLGTEFYMMADSRMVGYANLTVRPPPDYFGPLVFSYLDGLDAGLTTPVGNGLLRGKLFAGISPEKTPMQGNIAWDLAGSLLVGGHLDYLSGPWQVRFSHAQVRFNHELPVDAVARAEVIANVPEMSVVDKWSHFDSLGVVYDDGPLQLQLMLSRIEHDSAAYEDTRAGYAIAAYRLGDVTPYLGYSKVKSSPVRFSLKLAWSIVQ